MSDGPWLEALPVDVGDLLARTFWIGGSPCAGKSTIADLLAAAHGLRVYRCDDAYFQHQAVVTPEAQPVFSRIAGASCDELWMRPVNRQIEDELALYREEFPLILADLVGPMEDGPVLVEGAALLPHLLERIGVDRRRAIWIVPTEAFQRRRYAERAWRHDVLASCSNPARAWENWMARDAGFGAAVARSAAGRNRAVLVVDGGRSVAENTRAVEAWFGLSGDDRTAGPRRAAP